MTVQLCLEARVWQTISAYADVPYEDVRPVTVLESLDLDSLDVVKLTLELEEEFGLETTPDEEVMSWKTVSDVQKYIARAVAAKER